MFAKATLQRIEGRMLNPRKFTLRAEFGLETVVCTAQECEICEGIRAEGQEGMQTLIQEHRFPTTVCMREKSLSIHEDLRLGGEECSGDDKVLRASAGFATEDVRVIANKVMLRGNAKGEAIVLRDSIRPDRQRDVYTAVFPDHRAGRGRRRGRRTGGYSLKNCNAP